MYLIFGSFILLPFSIQAETLTQFLSEAARIEEYVFTTKNYRNTLPAIYGRSRGNPSFPNKISIVNVTLMYLKVLDLNEPQETVKFIAEAYIIWEDPRLSWNPKNFSEIDWIMVRRDQVWLPDVLNYDLSDGPTDTIPAERQYVLIYSNGSVYWYASGIFSYFCELDVSDFPFDKQVCSVNFAAYYSTDQEMQLTGDINPYLTRDSQLLGSNAWSLEKVYIGMENFTDEIRNWTYSELKFYLLLKRSDGYYVILIIIPSFVLTFLCIAGLFWAPISFDTYMDKLNLGYAAILAMVLVLQITTTNIPKTSTMPILSIYSVMNLALITIAILTVLAIGKYQATHKGDKTENKLCEFLRRRVHVVCLIFYAAATVINLIVLLTRKGASKPNLFPQ